MVSLASKHLDDNSFLFLICITHSSNQYSSFHDIDFIYYTMDLICFKQPKMTEKLLFSTYSVCLYRYPTIYNAYISVSFHPCKKKEINFR